MARRSTRKALLNITAEVIPSESVAAQARDQSETTGHEERHLEERHQRIARAAYFRAERRSFQGDGQLDDWLEAEREIDGATRAGGIQAVASRRAEGPTDVSSPAIPMGPTEDPEHIAPSHVQRVAAELGVPPSALRVAIERVGPRLGDVKRYLEQQSQR